MNTHYMVYALISGAIMACCFMAALFFLRFWNKTQDRLFGIFALSFAMMGLERIVLVSFAGPNEASPAVYLLRLTAFVLIILAIVDKNRAARPSKN